MNRVYGAFALRRETKTNRAGKITKGLAEPNGLGISRHGPQIC